MGCQEESDIKTSSEHQETNPENISIQDAFSFADKKLNVIANSIAKLSSDEYFRDIVYNEVDKQFDGDFDVLIEHLQSYATNGRMLRNLKIPEVDNAINAFKNINGVDYYPQIYIPNFENLKNNGLLGSKIPYIVINNGDENKEVYLNKIEDGNLIETEFMVDENFVSINEVWVISLNERYFGYENFYTSSSASTMVNSTPTNVIDRILVKCEKERIIDGKSEVNFLAVFSDWQFNNYFHKTYGGGKYQGGQIAHLSDSEISSNFDYIIDVNFGIIGDWDIQAPGTSYVDFFIFEYDGWPVGLNTWTFYHGSRGYNLQYRGDPYDMGTIYRYSWPSTVRENGCIY